MSYRLIEDDGRWAIGTCDRCGIEWTFDKTYLSRPTYNSDLCKDCKAKPVTYTGTGEYCQPWQGDIDYDTMHPINPDGTPYRPGIRICGHRDCIRPAHIIGGSSFLRKSRKPKPPQEAA